MSNALRLDFRNLPLVEAAVRASFASPIQLTFLRVNRIHDELRTEFPVLEESRQIEVAPGIAGRTVSVSPGQITGAVYAGNAIGLVGTVQDQVAVVRWVKRIADGGPEYPRYPALRNALWTTVEAIEKACDLDTPLVAVVNLSYVNFINVIDTSGVLKRYFSRSVQVEVTESAERVHKVELSWREQGADLRFRLEQVTATLRDEAIEGYRLTTVAGVAVSKDQNPRERLDYVHDRLQCLFRDLISDHAKREWELTEVPNG